MAITLDGTTGITTPDSISHDGDTNTAIRFPAADTVTVETSGAERFRVDSSGNLLVGKTNTLLANAGVAIYSDPYKGLVEVTRDDGQAMILNRKTSDGTIIDLRKDGTPVGSIGNYGTELYLGSTGGTDAFIRMGYDTVAPANSLGNNRDAAINLGATDNRFKDLYLSGGVYLGGTGSANKLDDYEEGTYFATLTPATSGTVTTSANTLRYSKVGRLVTVTGYMAVGSVSSPVGVLLISLPFTCLTSDSGASVKFNYVNSAVLSDFWSIVIPATNYISVYMGDTTSVASTTAQQVKSGTDMRISVTYTVA